MAKIKRRCRWCDKVITQEKRYNWYHPECRILHRRASQSVFQIRLRKMASMHANAKYKRWTEEEDALVLDTTLPQLEIAKQLGRTLSAVTMRRARLRHP